MFKADGGQQTSRHEGTECVANMEARAFGTEHLPALFGFETGSVAGQQSIIGTH